MRKLSFLVLTVAAVWVSGCSSADFAVTPADAGAPDTASTNDTASTSDTGSAIDTTPDGAEVATALRIDGAWSGSVRNENTSCPGAFGIGDVTAFRAIVTQAGVDVSVKLEGLVGYGFSLMFGVDTLTGALAGEKLSAKVVGTKEATDVPGCKHTWKAVLDGTIKGTTIAGTVIYTPVPVSGDCSKISSCSRTQSFSINKEP